MGALLPFALARRCQNESMHFEYTAQKHANDSLGLASESNVNALPRIFDDMVPGFWSKELGLDWIDCDNRSLTEAPLVQTLGPKTLLRMMNCTNLSDL